MAAQPKAEDVDTLLMLSEHIFDRAEAIARLKGNNNDPNQALNEYFDNPTSTRYRWDDSQFSNNEGGYDQNPPSFDVQGPDTFYQPGLAPSRPPSRSSNNRSPHNQVIDLTESHAAAHSLNSMSQTDRENAELQQALAASRADAGLLPQESGIMDTNEVHFGPATRSQYENTEWAMVPLGNGSAQEIILDPEPAQRKREFDVPAFLKPSFAGSRLGALLTIYHEIPIARETFLDRNHILSDYGYDKEWWTGKAIEVASVWDEDEEVSSSEAEQFCSELQRLMAFLDTTNRSYGSAEVLTGFSTIKSFYEQENDAVDMTTAFFKTWKEFLVGSKDVERLFTVGVSGQQPEAERRDFALFTVELPDSDSNAETIYDLADGLLWADVPNDTDLKAIPYLSHVGNVVAFHVTGGDASKNIPIPAIWYPDRYLETGRLAAAKMRQKQADVTAELEKISKIEDKLIYFNRGPGVRVKVQDVLNSALRHDEAQLQEKDLHSQENGESSEDMNGTEKPKKCDISAELRIMIANIDKKLLSLNEEKEKARETLREASKLFTEPSDDPDQPTLHPYSLRGVSTTNNTTYICRRSEPDLIDMDLNNEGARLRGDDWWKINFASSGSDPVTVEKTDLDTVLEAAMTESKNAIFVYADSTSMEWPQQPAPSSLQNFVRADNLAFTEEFPKLEESQGQSESSVIDPKSPSKRKYQSSEEESPNGINGASSLRRGSSLKSATRATILTDRSVSPKLDEDGDVIVGIDPFQMADEGEKGQEMKERSSMRMSMMAGAAGSRKIEDDSMDIDQVLEDADTREESAAVKRVGFAE